MKSRLLTALTATLLILYGGSFSPARAVAASVPTLHAKTLSASKASSPYTSEAHTVIKLKKPVSVTQVLASLRRGNIARSASEGQVPGNHRIIELRHHVNGHTGGFYPGNLSPGKIASTYSTAIRKQAGADPSITAITISGKVSNNPLTELAGDVDEITISPSTPKAPKVLGSRNFNSPYDHYWQPWEGIVKMTNNPSAGGIPRSINYYFGWRNQNDIDDGWIPSQESFEFDVKLYNEAYAGEGTRGSPSDPCPSGANSWYWASRTTDSGGHRLSDGGPLAWDTDLPEASWPYFDYADYEDGCQVIDFTGGVVYPTYVQPDCDNNGNCTDMRYHFYVGAGAGTQSSSPYSIAMQKLANTCDPTNPVDSADPSACTGVPANYQNARSHTVVPESSPTAPDCAAFYLDFSKDPMAPGGTQMYDPVEHFAPGTWLPGWQSSGDARYLCA